MVFKDFELGDEFSDNEGNGYVVLITKPYELVAKLISEYATPGYTYFVFNRSKAGCWVDRDDSDIWITSVDQ